MILDAKNERAKLIIEAIKALNDVCHEAWEMDDDEAFGEAYLLVRAAMDETMKQGRDIEEWNGGALHQYDALAGGMEVLLAYDAEHKVPGGDSQ